MSSKNCDEESHSAIYPLNRKILLVVNNYFVMCSRTNSDGEIASFTICSLYGVFFGLVPPIS